jgi:hypothetical protein
MKGIALLFVLSACGHGSPAAPPPPAKDAKAADAAVVELPAQPLGLADLAGFAWRSRGGQPAFRAARKAENKEDWPAVAASCKDALAADPGHLEAAWLYAVALAKTGKVSDVLRPLEVAGIGDYGKWALASLDQPALQPFLATPTGEAWRKRVDDDRSTYLGALGRAVFVTSHGDVYAFDPTTTRFLRLTRTYGAVVGTLRSAHEIAYVSRTKKHVGVGIISLTTGRTTHATVVPGTQIRIAAQPKGFAIKTGPTWQLLDDDGKLHPITAPKLSEYLDVSGKHVRLVRLPTDGIAGDWDDQGLASAIRLGLTNRTLTVPGQIDGSTVAWAPDHGHLAFVAQLDDCKPNGAAAAVFVAEATTGRLDELERAAKGLAIEWVGDRQLAIAGDHGVELVDLGGKLTALPGADGLIVPRRRPKCAAPDQEGSDEPPPPSDDEPGVGDEAEDAGGQP